jgi:hypothetical protein
MKSLVKAAALLVVALPLYAADMTSTTMTDKSAGADCSSMMGADKDKCMKDMKDSCMKMTDAAMKKDCMDKMDKMSTMHKDNGMMNKNGQ